MWTLYFLLHVWLVGSLSLPLMALVFWVGRKWKRLHFLTQSRKRWLFLWGLFGFLEATAAAGFLLATHFLGRLTFFPGWAGRAAWSVLEITHLHNAPIPVEFLLGLLFAVIGEIAVSFAFAALVWWIYSFYLLHPETPRTIAPIQRYAISLLLSACVLGFANRLESLRLPTCFDCFEAHGIPFTYFHEGGFAGGEGFVLERRPRKHSRGGRNRSNLSLGLESSGSKALALKDCSTLILK